MYFIALKNNRNHQRKYIAAFSYLYWRWTTIKNLNILQRMKLELALLTIAPPPGPPPTLYMNNFNHPCPFPPFFIIWFLSILKRSHYEARVPAVCCSKRAFWWILLKKGSLDTALDILSVGRVKGWAHIVDNRHWTMSHEPYNRQRERERCRKKRD